MNKLMKIDPQISRLTLPDLTYTPLFGNPFFSGKINTLILDVNIEYILLTKRFDEPIL